MGSVLLLRHFQHTDQLSVLALTWGVKKLSMESFNQQQVLLAPALGSPQSTESLWNRTMFVSYWILAGELTPYPWILVAFVFLSYVCAGRKRRVSRTSYCLGWTKTQILILNSPWATKNTRGKNWKQWSSKFLMEFKSIKSMYNAEEERVTEWGRAKSITVYFLLIWNVT